MIVSLPQHWHWSRTGRRVTPWISASRLMFGLALAWIAASASSCVLAKNDRRFFASCGSAQDCAGNLCYQGLCTANCVNDSGCNGGVCVQSVCAPRCGNGGTCPAKWTCSDWVCRPGNSVVSGGSDAVSDANSSDAASETSSDPDSDTGSATADVDDKQDTAGGSPWVGGRLAAGEAFTCAVLESGATRCWGINYNGQLATGDKETAHKPTLAKLVPTATAVAASIDHACALVGDGKVVCWGGAGTGAADGQPAVSAVVNVAIPTKATAIVAGTAFSCALDADGAVWCWGENNVGQLGDGTQTSRAKAAKVKGLPAAKALAAGHEHACAVTATQKLWCWGQFGAGWEAVAAKQPYLEAALVALPQPAADVAAGGLNTCALASDGTAMCWGDNGLGQLGLGDNTPHDGLQVASTLGKVNRIALGSGEHGCAVTLAGKVVCWGQGAQGQLGDGKGKRSGTAVEVPNLTGVLDVAVGVNHSCARLPGDQIWCWGGNEQGQTGNDQSDNEPNPVAMGTISDAKAVAVGHTHVCVLRQGGGAWCSGDNSHGALGNGDFATQLKPTAVSGLAQGLQISAGEGLTCGTSTPTTLSCWGGGVLVDSLTPAGVAGLPQADAVAVGAGTTCALLGGNGFCFGNDDYGSLGNGPQTGPWDAVVPVQGLSSAVAIAGKWQTFCAILGSGGVRCWGRNNGAQAGVSTDQEAVSSPTDVTLADGPQDGVAQVVLNYHGACARRQSGSVVCWGEGGQSHTGQTAPLPPSAVPNLVGATDIALSNAMLCAITGGKVVCVGGEVPGGWEGGKPPTVVPLAASAVDIDAGPGDVCAVLSNGTVWCWGYNEFGQLGNGKGPLLLPVLAKM